MKALKLFVITTFFLGILSYENVHSQFKEQTRYRTMIKLITDRQIDQAIKRAESFLAENPDDLEACYLLAMAHANKDRIAKAIEYVNKSLDLGLPLSRYMAGPRDLMHSLVNNKQFQQRVQDYGPFLLHGPMLSNVTDSGAEFWLRTFRETTVSVVA